MQKGYPPREQLRLATRAARRCHWVRYPELMQFGSEQAQPALHSTSSPATTSPPTSSPSPEESALEFERHYELSLQVSAALRGLAAKDVKLLGRVLIEEQRLTDAARELGLEYGAAHYRLMMSKDIKPRLSSARRRSIR